MSRNCPIMQRMKSNYENRSKTYLTRRVPVICRLDGVCFHTYTKGLVKPFDEGLIEDMQQTAVYLCENIQGAKCAYTQSDEISILITDYDKLTTEAWFNYNVQKMVSNSAGPASVEFYKRRAIRFFRSLRKDRLLDEVLINENLGEKASFDSRVFNIPKHEVNNYFLARQRDAEKNSISMLAQSLYGHTELHKKNGSDMQDMCWEKGHNWNDLHFSKKRGSLIMKNTYINDKLEYKDNKNGLKVGDIWYKPDSKAILYPDERGTLFEWANSAYSDSGFWKVIPIESIRTKWEVVKTPIFSQDKIIESLI